MFNIQGKIINIQDIVSGTSKGTGNEWKKQSFVIETEGQYPKKVCFTAWNDRIDQVSACSIGDALAVTFRVESREFNDRWYTDLTASDIAITSEAKGQSTSVAQTPNVESDEIPF